MTLRTPHLLVVGALGAETLPILQVLQHPRLHPQAPRLVTGTLDRLPVGILTCGVGPARAQHRLAEVLPLLPALTAILSLGTCGALVDDLPIGTAVTAMTLTDEAGRRCPSPVPWPGTHALSLITVPEPVWSAPTRERLAAQGHQACEMEAAALQRTAATTHANLRFFTLKVVSDLAGGHPEDPPQRPGPLALARFQARALRLSAMCLLPALRAGL